jgi:hypothetical protein
VAQVFKTKKDATHDVELLGVGLLGAGGKGGAEIEAASQTMSELQEQDEQGRLVLDDDGNPTPLTGAKLTSAAKKFAEERDLEVVSVADDKVAELPQEMGVKPDRPPAAEIAAENYAQVYEGLEPEYQDPEANLESAAITVEPTKAPDEKKEGDK